MQGVGQKGRVTEMKEHPAQVHHEKCVEPAQDAGEFVQNLPQPEFLDHQQDAVIQPPEEKIFRTHLGRLTRLPPSGM